MEPREIDVLEKELDEVEELERYGYCVGIDGPAACVANLIHSCS